MGFSTQVLFWPLSKMHPNSSGDSWLALQGTLCKTNILVFGNLADLRLTRLRFIGTMHYLNSG